MNKFNVIRAACVLGACATASAALAGPPAILPGSWTLAILPDTQYYSQSYPDIFNKQTQFLASYKTTLNIAYVLHEGDLVQNWDNTTQWTRASNALKTLDDASVPYSLVSGNHDIDGARGSLMANYFPVSRLDDQPTFGGVYPNEPKSPHNSYSLFSAGGTDWLVLALEFGPRDQIVQWADGVLKKYSQRQAMIVTHAYLYYDDTRYDWAAKGTSQSWSPYTHGTLKDLPGGVNDGQQMWDKLKDNPNLQFVFCGHVCYNGDGYGYLAGEADGGNVVHQILANYQYFRGEHCGDGYLRLLEFMADGRMVRVRTYSPWLDDSLASAEHDFVLTMTQVPEPSCGALLRAGVLFGSGAYAWRKGFFRNGIRRSAASANHGTKNLRLRRAAKKTAHYGCCYDLP